MTQSTGADAPKSTIEEDAIVEEVMAKRSRGDRTSTVLPPLEDETPAETPAEKTVTINDLCDRWGESRSMGPFLQDYMGQTGPWTETEYQELDRRMNSLAEADLFPGYGKKPAVMVVPSGKGGPHGPDCECGDLSAEELAAVEELMDLLGPGLKEALGVGRTPAEKRTGVSDPEAAILDLLGSLQPLVDAVIKDGGAIGVATAMMDKDPLRAMTAIGEESKKLRKDYRAIRDVVVQISTFLSACKGERAKDAEGLPIWFLPASEGVAGWLTTAAAESPGDGWKAVYVR